SGDESAAEDAVETAIAEAEPVLVVTDEGIQRVHGRSSGNFEGVRRMPSTISPYRTTSYLLRGISRGTAPCLAMSPPTQFPSRTPGGSSKGGVTLPRRGKNKVEKKLGFRQSVSRNGRHWIRTSDFYRVRIAENQG